MAIEDARFLVAAPSADLNNEILSRDISLANVLRNGSFESWSQGDSTKPDWWDIFGIGTAEIHKVTDRRVGPFGVKLTAKTSDFATLAQTLPCDDNMGVTYTLGCWIKCSTGGKACVKIWDGGPATTYHNGNSLWQFLTITKYVAPASVLQMCCHVEASGGGDLDAYFSGAVVIKNVASAQPGVIFAHTPHFVDKGHDVLNVDQSQTGTENAWMALRNNVNAKLGQGFKAGVSKELTRATIKLVRNMYPKGNVWLELYADNSGLPDETKGPLATSGKMPTALVVSATTYEEFTFVFPRNPNCQLIKGNRYHLVVAGDWTMSVNDYLKLREGYTNPYADGQGSYFASSSWSAQADYDWWFKTYYGDDGSNIVLDKIPKGAGLLPIANLPALGKVTKVINCTWEGNNDNSREINLDDDYDFILVFLEESKTYNQNHNQIAHAFRTSYGSIYARSSIGALRGRTMTNNNGWWQGKMTGDDANKIMCGSAGSDDRGTNNGGWTYRLIGFKFSSMVEKVIEP